MEMSMIHISMGNPHAVFFVDDVDNIEIEKIGPAIETHPRFPDRTNVEFVQIVDESHVKMRVWERGAGETMACGTGACCGCGCLPVWRDTARIRWMCACWAVR